MKTSSRILLATLLAGALGTASAVEYRLTQLPVDPGARTIARAINNAGAVLGSVGENTVGVVWQNGGTRYLPVSDNTYYSYGVAINAAGDVAGTGFGAHGQASAAAWSAAGATRIIPYSAEYTYGADINAGGAVVFNYTDMYRHHGVLWTGSEARHLDALSPSFAGADPADPIRPSSDAAALNDLGDVVGFSHTAQGPVHAVLWRDGQVIDLHGSVGRASAATDINNAGQILLNTTLADGSTRAGIWTAGSIDHYGVSYGASAFGLSINAHGDFVGWAGNGTTDRRAALWKDGVALDLASLVVGGLGDLAYLEVANGINDLGQIVGNARTADGDFRAFLLTPVPEPSHWAMLAAGLGIVALRRRIADKRVR